MEDGEGGRERKKVEICLKLWAEMCPPTHLHLNVFCGSREDGASKDGIIFLAGESLPQPYG